jgi:glycosyltransferase involved in cell wall biosynthesis
MPEVTASADISVAPYDRSKLRSLELGFFWSPLKIFEALSSGVPVITLDIPPLNDIVRGGREGIFFKENDPGDLARVISSLADDRPRREAMGISARERAPRFSWAAHAAQIESILLGLKAA